jgi:hypothetical protein
MRNIYDRTKERINQSRSVHRYLKSAQNEKEGTTNESRRDEKECITAARAVDETRAVYLCYNHVKEVCGGKN